MSIAAPAPVERFATFIRELTLAVTAMSGGDRLSYLLIGLIIDRLRGIKQRFVRLAARIQAGTYAPRRFAGRRSPAVRRPRTPGKLPTTYGWLLPLVPEALAFRSQLGGLLRTPEMAALLAAAPASLARPIRSLCWMLRLDPPPILPPPPGRLAPDRPEPAGPGRGTANSAGAAPFTTFARSAAVSPPPPRACGPPSKA